MNRNFRDGRNFVAKLTPRRIWNMGRILTSYYASRISGRPTLHGLPISLSVEPTTSCNLRCPECPSGLRSFTRPTGMLDASMFRSLIDQLAPSLSYLIFYFQGEPYLHPELLPMIAYAGSKNIYTATSTNAHYLNDQSARATVESGLDRLIISIDGVDQSTYEGYRIGGKLEKVIEGTQHIVKWKKKLRSATPHIIFQFLVVRSNEHQIDDVHRLASELGVDEVALKTAQIYDYQNGSDLIPSIDKYARYRRQADGKYVIKNQLMDHCWKMWHSSVVTWDGNVVPCCFDKDAHHVMGNLNHDDFQSIWQGDKYAQFRQNLLRSRNEIEMCRNCSEGTKVWA